MIKRVLLYGLGSVVANIFILPCISYPTYQTRFEFGGFVVYAVFVSLIFAFYLFKGFSSFKKSDDKKIIGKLSGYLVFVFFIIVEICFTEWAWSAVINRL